MQSGYIAGCIQKSRFFTLLDWFDCIFAVTYGIGPSGSEVFARKVKVITFIVMEKHNVFFSLSFHDYDLYCFQCKQIVLYLPCFSNPPWKYV